MENNTVPFENDHLKAEPENTKDIHSADPNETRTLIDKTESTSPDASQEHKDRDQTVKEKPSESETIQSETTQTNNDEKIELMKKNKELQNQLQELNDKYIRLLAEFDNFRKRTRKEKEDLIKYAGEEIWKSILPVIDDFERAIKENQNTEDSEVIKKGFELIYNKLKHITSQNHLVAIESLHKDFDAEFMEAIAKVPAPSEEMKGKVIEELEKAYQLNDKLIRHAKVVVGE